MEDFPPRKDLGRQWYDTIETKAIGGSNVHAADEEDYSRLPHLEELAVLINTALLDGLTQRTKVFFANLHYFNFMLSLILFFFLFLCTSTTPHAMIEQSKVSSTLVQHSCGVQGLIF